MPAYLAADAEFVTAGTLHAETGREGSVQLQILTTKPEPLAGLQPTAVAETNAGGPWTSNNRGVFHATPILVTDGSAARRQFEAAFADFRTWFPTALCYTKIVPVDEVVTLTLFYREDDHLRRLMLDEAEAAQLDRLWDELHFVSLDALKLVDAFEQLLVNPGLERVIRLVLLRGGRLARRGLKSRNVLNRFQPFPDAHFDHSLFS